MANILVACECSGRVRDAFIALGHNAISCDLDETETPGPHYRGSVFDILYDDWDAVIGFPPCTYLSSVANAWRPRNLKYGKTQEALEFFRHLYQAPAKFIALENPVGYINSHFRKPDQIIQPYWFGDPAQKRTCLWLKNLPPLHATNVVPLPIGVWRKKKEKQEIMSKWWYLTTRSDNPAKMRSRTFQGVADAMAAQWSPVISKG